jgi:predicted enzyme related to lactoylglutathione lyase
MGKRTEYPHGFFSFADVMTTDVEGAKSFYTAFFGWSAQTQRAGQETEYTLFLKEGAPVAGTFEQPPESRERGMPPSWVSYVNVDDADKAAELARDGGGTVVVGPQDVVDAGRMAAFLDPQGAGLCAWQPRNHFGAGIVNEPGAMTWNELRSPDPRSVTGFYERIFGWSYEETDMGRGLAYITVKVGDESNGGMIPSQVMGPDVPPHWGVYFAVEDTDKAVERAEGLGAKVLAPPMDVPMGRFASFMDPQGAAFSIFSGKLDP